MGPGNEPVKVWIGLWDVRKGIATGLLTCSRAGDVQLSPSAGVIACFHRSSNAYLLICTAPVKLRSSVAAFRCRWKRVIGLECPGPQQRRQSIVLPQKRTGGKPAGDLPRGASHNGHVARDGRSGHPGGFTLLLQRRREITSSISTGPPTGEPTRSWSWARATGGWCTREDRRREHPMQSVPIPDTSPKGRGMMVSGAYYLTYLITLS